MEKIRELYQSLVNNLPLNVYRIDLVGRITFINDTFLTHYDLQRDQVMGYTAYDFYPKEMATKYRKDDAWVVANNQQFKEIEINRNPSTGEINYVQVIKTPVTNECSDVVGVQGVFWDVTEQEVNKLLLRASEARLSKVLGCFPDYVVVLNNQFEICYINRAIGEQNKDSLIGAYYPALVPNIEQELVIQLKLCLQSGNTSSFSSIHTSKEGTICHFENRIVLLPNTADQNLDSIMITSSDVTKKKLHEIQLEHMAKFDSLTHIPNRVLLIEHFERLIQEDADGAQQHALIFVDLDDFKPVNDTWGHCVGDLVLQTIANRISSSLRGSDFLARVGGDEFVMIARHIQSQAELLPVLDRILTSAVEPIYVNDGVITVSVSIGVVLFNSSKRADLETLTTQADYAMYRAKALGKNRFVFSGSSR